MARHWNTVRQFAERNPAFSEASLRWKIAKAEENGLAEAGAILRHGRRVFIDTNKFFDWLESCQNRVN